MESEENKSCLYYDIFRTSWNKCDCGNNINFSNALITAEAAIYFFTYQQGDKETLKKTYQSLFFHSIVLTSWNVVRDGTRLPRSPVSKAAALNPGFVYNLLEDGSNVCIKHLIQKFTQGFLSIWNISEYL